MSTELSKAEIMTTDGSETITVTCLFNPKEYTLAKSNTWPKEAKPKENQPVVNFGGGSPATLNLDLMFDSYQCAPDGESSDIRTSHINKLWRMMYVDPSLAEKKKNKQGRPPKVRFSWGKAISFEAVITSLSVTFTLFLPNGTPVRATAKVAFQQVQDTKFRIRRSWSCRRTRRRAASAASAFAPSRTVTGSTSSRTRSTATPRGGVLSPPRTASAIRATSGQAACS
jgi:hypothetical protein